LAKSRQNLGLRTIDIYYVHNPGQLFSTVSPAEARAQLKAAFAMLEEAASRGEIGGYGVATWDELRVGPDARGHFSLEQAVAIARELAGDSHHFTTVQLPINLAIMEAVRAPTQQLAGQTLTVVEACAELGLTVVASASLMQARLTHSLPAALHSLFPAAQTDAQRALAFVRPLPGVTTALVGMKQTSHVDENTGAARPAT
jgi:aryl-alcohol dehydrogenase-like predicted oxidoreductase